MSGLLDAAFSFPAVIFTFAFFVVVAYWLLVLVGGAGLDVLDGDADTDAAPGWQQGLGLGGVPVTIALSFFVIIAWLASIVGGVLLMDSAVSGAGLVAALIGVLVFALCIAMVGTRVLIAPLKRVFHQVPAQSRADFVGKICVVRTSSVGPDFGQAEVTSPDGSSAIVQVRQTAEHAQETPLRAGSSALIYDYDADGEFFWVAPVDPALDTFRP
ncbi:hypothetical protein ONR57_21485 [Hoyosella sp. YIM 151337]|uniref:hypothetical protein n=1 Tax=Hoyosella sp. YIM 151337 TaxID=2992742 RepID=UPI002236B3FF|nr:hypothetical protein [Hoyosella sp. YIM 151337]MCW4355881.1 hypothetical protein [Hoyosella sp. YIM 151337]